MSYETGSPLVGRSGLDSVTELVGTQRQALAKFRRDVAQLTSLRLTYAAQRAGIERRTLGDMEMPGDSKAATIGAGVEHEALQLPTIREGSQLRNPQGF